MPGRGARAERPPIRLPNPPLVAGALRLRAPAERDIEAIHAACQDPLIVRYTRLPHNYSRRDARAFVFGAPARRDAGISLELVVSDLDDGSLTGVVGLVVDRYDWERAEIGYWTAPAHRGRGIAGTALALLARWALGPGGFVRVELTASVHNRPSLAVAERAGFRREGVARASWPTPQGREDMAVYSLLSGDLGPPSPAGRPGVGGRT